MVALFPLRLLPQIYKPADHFSDAEMASLPAMTRSPSCCCIAVPPTPRLRDPIGDLCREPNDAKSNCLSAFCNSIS